MARSMEMAPDAMVYRAVITKPTWMWGTWEVHTVCEGPYATEAAAKARVTYWTQRYAETDDYGRPTGRSKASGYVEPGTVTWGS